MQLLLITDLDNTLVGDDRATLAFNQTLAPLRSQICIAYSTGRSLTSTAALLQECPLMVPDVLITGVGTGIYQFDIHQAQPENLQQQAQLDPDWVKQLDQNWDRDAIVAIAEQFADLQPQPASEQNPWKLSYWLESPESQTLLGELKTQLHQQGLATQVVFSSDRDVDILPPAANKGNAVVYLQQSLYPAAHSALVCGDSGNDISLFEQVELGVIVQNAQPELLLWHQQQGRPGHYLASAPFAWGILEGLRHFQFVASSMVV